MIEQLKQEQKSCRDAITKKESEKARLKAKQRQVRKAMNGWTRKYLATTSLASVKQRIAGNLSTQRKLKAKENATRSAIIPPKLREIANYVRSARRSRSEPDSGYLGVAVELMVALDQTVAENASYFFKTQLQYHVVRDYKSPAFALIRNETKRKNYNQKILVLSDGRKIEHRPPAVEGIKCSWLQKHFEQNPNRPINPEDFSILVNKIFRTTIYTKTENDVDKIRKGSKKNYTAVTEQKRYVDASGVYDSNPPKVPSYYEMRDSYGRRSLAVVGIASSSSGVDGKISELETELGQLIDMEKEMKQLLGDRESSPDLSEHQMLKELHQKVNSRLYLTFIFVDSFKIA